MVDKECKKRNNEGSGTSSASSHRDGAAHRWSGSQEGFAPDIFPPLRSRMDFLIPCALSLPSACLSRGLLASYDSLPSFFSSHHMPNLIKTSLVSASS